MTDEEGLRATRFREALSHWASGVTVAAVRDEKRVLATTVTAFLSVSVEPPLVLLSLGPSAQILPFLSEGTSFAVSVLADHQGRRASVFADAYPVGDSPFPEYGEPFLADALVHLGCRVERLDRAGDHHLVLALVEGAELRGGEPLIRYRRSYRRLQADG